MRRKVSATRRNHNARWAFMLAPIESSGADKKRNDNEEALLRPRCRNVARSVVTRNASPCAAGTSHPERFGLRGRRERTLSLRATKGLHRTHGGQARLSWTPHRLVCVCLLVLVLFVVLFVFWWVVFFVFVVWSF